MSDVDVIVAGNVDVIVVGAGLAGLRAAVDLVDGGRDVVVLEARDRVGGRVWTHHFENSQWAERGAEFIDSDHREVLALAEELGLTLLDARAGRDDSKRLLDVSGRAAPFAFHQSLAGDLDRWRSSLHELATGVDADDPCASPNAAALDEGKLSDFVGDLQLGVMARVVVGREVRTEFMLGPDEISQLTAAWMASRHAISADGREAHRIAGGNDQLALGLAARLGDRVRLSTEVASISPDEGLVHLVTGEVMAAEHIVATVPLPVLGRLWDTMPFELSRVGYGIGGKVSVQVGRRIWLDYGRDGSVISERAWGQLWETSEGQPGDQGVMTALLSSHDGAALAALPDIVPRVVAEAERIFPGFRGLAGESVHTDWTNDPFSLGCYACFGSGRLLAAWPLLRRRFGRMLLAGEHTDSLAGFMEGALRSGARVAREILGSQRT